MTVGRLAEIWSTTQHTAAGEADAPTGERILVEASRLFALKGYHGTSTRDIAAAVGIRQPSLFHHFRSKRAIMDALLEYDLSSGVRLLGWLATAPGSPAVRLYRYIAQDTYFALTSPYDLRGVYLSDLLSEPEFRPWRKKYDEWLKGLQSIVQQGIRCDEFMEIDPRFVSMQVDAFLLHIVRLAGNGPRRSSDDRTEADTAASFVLRAVLRRPDDLNAVRRSAHAGPPFPKSVSRRRSTRKR